MQPTSTTLRFFRLLTCVTGLFVLAGCQSEGGRKCKFSNQTMLPSLERGGAAWPKFRRDMANTGHISGVRLTGAPVERWVFPSRNVRGNLGPLSSTPLIDANGNIVVIGGGTDPDAELAGLFLYVLDGASGAVKNLLTPAPVPSPTATATPGPPLLSTFSDSTATPLLGADGTVYVAFSDGTLRRVRSDGSTVTNTVVGGFISAAPNIGSDGTVYVGSQTGIFSAVCPNGVPRFVTLIGSTQSAPSVAADGTIVVSGNDGQVRAFDFQGRLRWRFLTSAPVRGAVVIDNTPAGGGVPRFYILTVTGRLVAGQLDDGKIVWLAELPALGDTGTAPALGARALYVADEGGALHALDPTTGALLWTFNAGAPIHSAPAVASEDSVDTVVFGTGDGLIYAVRNLSDRGEIVWTYRIDPEDGAIGRSSPSIDFSGNVYFGTEGGRVYSIGQPAPVVTPTPSATPSP